MKASYVIGVCAAMMFTSTFPSVALGNSQQGCSGGAPFKVAVVKVGGPGARPIPSAGPSPIEALRNKCMAQAPDYITEDSKALLSKIKLARAQSDSIAKLKTTYLALQKTVISQITASLNATDSAQGKAQGKAEPAPQVDARKLYLSPEMMTLREHHAVALRAVLTAEQHPRFEENLAALRKKEADAG